MAYANPTIADERVPTQEELKRVLLGADPGNRVVMALMAHPEVRPEVLGNYLGRDGFRIKDFPDLKVKGKTVECEHVPCLVVVRAELSKAGHRYFTFLGKEGCDYLRAYLQSRLQRGEKLEPETGTIHPIWANKTFVRTINVGNLIRTAFRSARFK